MAELELKLLARQLSIRAAFVALRELNGLTQVELARRVRMSKQHVCDIEKGRRFVGPAKAAAIARSLGHPAALFVRLALQDAVNHDGLKYRVSVEAV